MARAFTQFRVATMPGFATQGRGYQAHFLVVAESGHREADTLGQGANGQKLWRGLLAFFIAGLASQAT